MNKYKLFFGVVCSLLILAFSSNPPNGRTGAPFDGSCSGCHAGGAQNGTIEISGVPDEIMLGTTYPLEVKLAITSGTASRGGFQLVAVDQNNANAGSFSNLGGNTGTNSSGGRTYFEHSGAKNFGDNDELAYESDWTAPEGMGVSEVTFYYVANFADGNGSTSGDRIVTNATTVNVEADAGNMVGPIAISQVLGNGTVELTNVGNDTIDISSYWLCNRPEYEMLGNLTVECGSLSLAPGALVAVSTGTISISGNGGEIGLYTSNSFGSSDAMGRLCDLGCKSRRNKRKRRCWSWNLDKWSTSYVFHIRSIYSLGWRR